MKQEFQLHLQTLRLFHRMSPSAVPVAFVLALVEALSPFVNIVLSARILDELLHTKDTAVLQNLVLWVLFLNLLLSLLARILRHARSYFGLRLGQMKNQYQIEKCSDMDYEHVENPDVHKMIQHFNEGFNMSGGLGYHLAELGDFIRAFGKALSSLVVVASLIASSALSFLCLLGMICLAAALSMYLKRKSNAVYDAINSGMLDINRQGSYLSLLISDYQFGKDVRLYNMAQLLLCQFERLRDSVRQWFMRRYNGTIGNYLIADSVNTVLVGLIYSIVVTQAFFGLISVGSIMMYIGAITQFSTAVNELSDLYVNLTHRNRYVRDYIHFLNLPLIKPRGLRSVEKRPNAKYELRFEHVTFRYPGSETPVLEDVSFTLRPGEKLAIVGMNGAGKTTFIKLLCRLYDPDSGRILLNGVDIRDYNYQEYFSIFGVVFQDFQLFAFPVGQNVAAEVDFHEARVLNVLDQASVGARVRAMPRGAETYLYKNYAADGMEISGGEAQKIAIARALYRDAPILILDEPTAALDPISEHEIYTTINNAVGTKTAVYISHRLSSCRFCERIAVFDKGQIIQNGSHDELLANEQGKYFEMWNAQAQYYITPKEASMQNQVI